MKIAIRLAALEIGLECQDPISEEVIGFVVKTLYKIRDAQMAKQGEKYLKKCASVNI